SGRAGFPGGCSRWTRTPQPDMKSATTPPVWRAYRKLLPKTFVDDMVDAKIQERQNEKGAWNCFPVRVVLVWNDNNRRCRKQCEAFRVAGKTYDQPRDTVTVYASPKIGTDEIMLDQVRQQNNFGFLPG